MPRLLLSALAGAALLAPTTGALAAAGGRPGARAETRHEAMRDCREDRREHPARFHARYGTGKAALHRCVRHELRHDRDDHGHDDR